MPIDWFKSYLSNREQFVNYMGCNSERLHVSKGVPQGSILGPLLFMIFINDLPLSINCLSLHTYADDQTLLARAHNIVAVNESINNETGSISNWMA